MSERSSYVTEYIYCEDCFNALAASPLSTSREKYLCACDPIYYPGLNRQRLPILAGKVGGLITGTDAYDEIYGKPGILSAVEGVRLCHDVEILVLAESGAVVSVVVGPTGHHVRVLRGAT